MIERILNIIDNHIEYLQKRFDKLIKNVNSDEKIILIQKFEISIATCLCLKRQIEELYKKEEERYENK